MDKEKFQRSIDEAVKRAIAWFDAKLKQGPAKASANKSAEQWDAGEVGYFDLHFDKSYPNRDIISVNKKTWIWDVHLFVAHIKDLVQLKGALVVQNNLNTALKRAT